LLCYHVYGEIKINKGDYCYYIYYYPPFL